MPSTGRCASSLIRTTRRHWLCGASADEPRISPLPSAAPGMWPQRTLTTRGRRSIEKSSPGRPGPWPWELRSTASAASSQGRHCAHSCTAGRPSTRPWRWHRMMQYSNSGLSCRWLAADFCPADKPARPRESRASLRRLHRPCHHRRHRRSTADQQPRSWRDSEVWDSWRVQADPPGCCGVQFVNGRHEAETVLPTRCWSAKYGHHPMRLRLLLGRVFHDQICAVTRIPVAFVPVGPRLCA